MSRKEKFNNWVEGMIEDLESRSNYCYEANSFKKWHWKQLWEIFDRNIDTNHFGSKEQLIAYDEADQAGRAVILEAHNLSDSDLLQDELMDHYMNSSNYD